MTAKAVFASQTFAVYVTGPELRFLRGYGHITCDLYLGKEPGAVGSVNVGVGPGALSELVCAIDAERAAIDAARSKMLPRSDTRSAIRQRRKVESRD